MSRIAKGHPRTRCSKRAHAQIAKGGGLPSKPRTQSRFRSAPEYASHHASDHIAQEFTGIWRAAAAAAPAAYGTIRILAGTRLRGDGFGQQRLVLELVQKAAAGIAARGLPAGDHGACFLVELARQFGVEAESSQPPLHIAPLDPVQSDLVFRRLIGFLGESSRIDAGA